MKDSSTRGGLGAQDAQRLGAAPGAEPADAARPAAQPPPPRPSLAFTLALGAVLLVGLLLRLAALGQESLWADEFHSVASATQPTCAGVLAAAREQGVQAPYFLLLHGWIRLAGQSDPALRLPSALAGALGPLALYALALTLFPGRRRLALFAAGLLAVSPMHLWYSQEARPYALQVLCELVTLLALGWALGQAETTRAQGRPPTRDAAAWLCAAALLADLGVEIHNYSIFIWLLCAAATLWAGLRRRSLTPGLCALGLLILALGLIHPLFSICDRLVSRRFLDFLPPRYGPAVLFDVARAQLLGPFWSPLPFWLQGLGIGLGAVLIVLGLTRLYQNCQAQPLAPLILSLGLFFTLALPTLISFYKSIIYYGQRYLVIGVPFTVLALAAGAGAGRGWRRWLTGALAAALLLLQGAYLRDYYAYRQKHTWDSVGAYLALHTSPETRLCVLPARNAGLLRRYLPPGRQVQGVELSDLARLTAHAGGPLVLVTYNNLREWLLAHGSRGPVDLVLFETHQPGQTLWVHKLARSAAGPSAKAARDSKDGPSTTENPRAK